LGLATVYGIVKQNNGFIQYDSIKGKGTTAKIYLPSLNADADNVSTFVTNLELKRGNETILVVEDEELVRELTVKVLGKCGYNVIKAKNGIEALALWKKNSARVDLLLTDVVMPNMSGRQLAKRLSNEKIDLKILFMTGYSEKINQADDEMLGEKTICLQKPFTSDELTQEVRRVLNS